MIADEEQIPRLIIFILSMENWKKFPRVFFLFALLTSLLAGISAPVLGNESAGAAPMGKPLH